MKFNQVELCWNFIIVVDFRKWSHFLLLVIVTVTGTTGKCNQFRLFRDFLISVNFIKWSHFLLLAIVTMTGVAGKNVINSGYSGIS